MSDVPEVLFVCVHNAGRSQMAAALLDRYAAGRVRVRSAGSAPSSEINPAVTAGFALGHGRALRSCEVRAGEEDQAVARQVVAARGPAVVHADQ